MEISFSFCKVLTTASERGCSDSFSKLYSIFRVCSKPFSHRLSTTMGCPAVIVPVLSRIIVSIFWAISKLWASLIKIPFSAPFPMPTIMAVGVAKPNAQGQAIINTVTIANNPLVKPFVGAKNIHAIKAIIEMLIIAGTKNRAILSTNF